MKKVIRLTENDLARIVKKVINEQSEEDSPTQMLDKRGRQRFISELERLVQRFKSDEPIYSSLNSSTPFYTNQLLKFKTDFDTLISETMATNPSR